MPPVASAVLFGVLRALGIVGALLVISLGGCAHVTPVVNGIVDCSEAGLHAAALGILDDAATALATDNYNAALADLVGRFGEAAVVCAVNEIAGKSARMAQATGNDLESSKALRARAWLTAQPLVAK